jgi:hypothetical protein
MWHPQYGGWRNEPQMVGVGFGQVGDDGVPALDAPSMDMYFIRQSKIQPPTLDPDVAMKYVPVERPDLEDVMTHKRVDLEAESSETVDKPQIAPTTEALHSEGL